MYYLPLLIFVGVTYINISSVRGDYEADQKALLQKFGKGAILAGHDVPSICQIKKEYNEIMQMNCPGERKNIKELIDKQLRLKLIGWATVYQAKPSGTLLHNIEFDHIPPGSADPFTFKDFKSVTDFRYKINGFKDQAPTLAISNYDHRSALWKQCSTTGGIAPIMRKYKKFVRQGNHMCAIFANLFCLKDIEKHIAKIERISETLAFERYRNGFKTLINLHYDFGRDNNKVINFMEKVSSAYCELRKSRPKATGCKPEHFVEDDTDYYCLNVAGYFQRCNVKERNLIKTEHKILHDWLDLLKTDDEMLTKCGLTRDEWQELFPKINWDYNPEADPNPAGDEGNCVSYERKWVLDEATIKENERIKEEEKERKKKKEEEDSLLKKRPRPSSVDISSSEEKITKKKKKDPSGMDGSSSEEEMTKKNK